MTFEPLSSAFSVGGLASEIALVLKTLRPRVRVIGVSMERGPAMYRSQVAGKPVQVEEQATLADALGGEIGLANRYTFTLITQLLDNPCK